MSTISVCQCLYTFVFVNVCVCVCVRVCAYVCVCIVHTYTRTVQVLACMEYYTITAYIHIYTLVGVQVSTGKSGKSE